MNDKPKYIPITDIKNENSNVKTFSFDLDIKAKPGQFVMLWIPGIDQKPFSVKYSDESGFSLSIFKIGALTEKLFTMNVGDRVGISGPYGNPFSELEDTHYIMIAGGYGAAPLAFLTKKVITKNSTVDFCIGARSENLLLFRDEISGLNNTQLHISTDDGSAGHQGYVTDNLKKIIEENKDKKILVCTCGPEVMEKKVLDICNELNVDCEISIERYMKCGFGICGQCCVDDIGFPICDTGPVVSKKLANQILEFGVYHRDKSGKIIRK